ncbi:MAG TPA: sn-glycerol-3-phosphate ABC transporter ATP-binding protein UgpC [Polyangiaceae bacterium]|nr:sn-glycerol-3-phosphate ABC transporter ATP-binding protein UgpC [Polyangiaceae bacterium]
MASVDLSHVDKVYSGGVKAVEDFNLTIADREFIVLVGPSGCGKTTTLRMIAGLESVTGGTIAIGGRVVNDVPPKDRDIAMVFQSYALYPHMSVYDNMAFGLVMRKTPKSVVESKVRKAAEILGISGLLDRKPKQLSGGQRQRVAVGRAIVRDPKCFLFDEPLSNLDAKLRVEMRAEIKRLHLELGSTTVYVTHDQEEAITLGDRVVVMKDGVVQQCASALEIYHRPSNRFVAGFLGSPPMNFLAGRLAQRDGTLWFEDGSAVVAVPEWARAALAQRAGTEIVLGIRPEALSDAHHARFETKDNALSMTIRLVQPLGDTMYVHLETTAGRSLVGHFHALAGLTVGEKLLVYFDPDRLHFFEPGDVGRSLVPTSPFSDTMLRGAAGRSG